MPGRNRVCCCGGVGVSCSFCDSNTTPATVQMAYSGIVVCPGGSCFSGVSGFIKYSDLVAAQDPNSTFECPQIEGSSCGWRLTQAIGNIDAYPSAGCTGTPTPVAFEIESTFSLISNAFSFGLRYQPVGGAYNIGFYSGGESKTTPYDCIGESPWVSSAQTGVACDSSVYENKDITDKDFGSATATAV